MVPLRTHGVALVAVLLIVAGTGGAVTRHDVDLRDRLAAARERDAATMTGLALPREFTPIACASWLARYDRCWRVDSLPDEALDDMVRALGVADVTPDCTRALKGYAMGCNTIAGTVTVVATRDLNEAWTTKDDILAGTSTLGIGQF